MWRLTKWIALLRSTQLLGSLMYLGLVLWIGYYAIAFDTTISHMIQASFMIVVNIWAIIRMHLIARRRKPSASWWLWFLLADTVLFGTGFYVLGETVGPYGVLNNQSCRNLGHGWLCGIGLLVLYWLACAFIPLSIGLIGCQSAYVLRHHYKTNKQVEYMLLQRQQEEGHPALKELEDGLLIPKPSIEPLLKLLLPKIDEDRPESFSQVRSALPESYIDSLTAQFAQRQREQGHQNPGSQAGSSASSLQRPTEDADETATRYTGPPPGAPPSIHSYRSQRSYRPFNAYRPVIRRVPVGGYHIRRGGSTEKHRGRPTSATESEMNANAPLVTDGQRGPGGSRGGGAGIGQFRPASGLDGRDEDNRTVVSDTSTQLPAYVPRPMSRSVSQRTRRASFSGPQASSVPATLAVMARNERDIEMQTSTPPETAPGTRPGGREGESSTTETQQSDVRDWVDSARHHRGPYDERLSEQ